MEGLRIQRVILFVCVMALSSPEGWAQNSSIDATRVDDLQIQVHLEYAQLTFLVRDGNGRLIPGLEPNDFVIEENQVPREIVALRQQEVPISAVVMVDTSWSMASFMEKAVQTGHEFFQGLSNEQAAFVRFSDRTSVVLDWGENQEELTLRLSDVQSDGKTALHDSVAWVADEMLGDRSGKKVVILISDGIDTISQQSFEMMMNTLRSNGISLYAIIYTNPELDRFRSMLRSRGSKLVDQVSRDFQTFLVRQNEFLEESLRFGGRTIFSRGFDDLERIYQDIVDEMKSQYVMLYRSEVVDEDEIRNVEVQTTRVPGKIFIDVTR